MYKIQNGNNFSYRYHSIHSIQTQSETILFRHSTTLSCDNFYHKSSINQLLIVIGFMPGVSLGCYHTSINLSTVQENIFTCNYARNNHSGNNNRRSNHNRNRNMVGDAH